LCVYIYIFIAKIFINRIFIIASLISFGLKRKYKKLNF
jgi:hypothetical protein